MATPIALPTLAEVRDKPLTEPTWRGATALNMPLQFGDWKSAQPNPKSMRVSMTEIGENRAVHLLRLQCSPT